MCIKINKFKKNTQTSIKLFLTQVIKFRTIWAQSFVMVPFQLPTLPRRDATIFTPDARGANLQRKPTCKKKSNQGLCSMSNPFFLFDKQISYPGFPLLALFGIAGSKAGSVIAVLTSFAFQQWLWERSSLLITVKKIIPKSAK